MNNNNSFDIISNRLTEDFKSLDRFISVIVPINDDDKYLLHVARDMMQGIIKDLQHPSTANESFKLDELMEDWDMISEQMVQYSSMGIAKLVDNIASLCSIEGEEIDE